jgi:hypothetical protein
LLDDLSTFTSPSRRIDGAGIYNEALVEAGQPAAGSAILVDTAVR